MTREVVPGRGFTSPGAARVVEVTDVRACLAFGWVCSVTSWQAPNKTPVCVCVCVCVCVPRNQFNHAQTERFNNPTVLPLLQTMSSLGLGFAWPCRGAA